MLLLRIFLCCCLLDVLTTATYEELRPDLSPQRLAEWNLAYQSGQTQLADYIWFAHAHGYGTAINYKQARIWHQRADGMPLADLFRSWWHMQQRFLETIELPG